MIKVWNEKVKNIANNGRYVSMSRSHNLLSADGMEEQVEEALSDLIIAENFSIP